VGAGAVWKLVAWCELTIGKSSGEVGAAAVIPAFVDADADGNAVGGEGSAGGVEKAGRRWRSCVAQQWHWHVHAAVGEKCGSVTSYAVFASKEDDEEALRRAGAVAAPSGAASTGASRSWERLDGEYAAVGEGGSGGERRDGGTAAAGVKAAPAVAAADERPSADRAGNEAAWRGAIESPPSWAAGDVAWAGGGAFTLDDDGDDDEDVCAC
jgi:hypothetical protein